MGEAAARPVRVEQRHLHAGARAVGDVDLAAANDCMKKGLDILAKGNVIEGTDQLLSADSQKQKEDLFSEFFANPSLTAEDAQKRFAEIIASAE